MTNPEFIARPDEAARRVALDAARSFIVQAPAGSGKTELLIQRFLALLARVDRPEAVVAMTFTRKAAAEIRERIIRALREASEAMPDRPHRAVTWRLARAVLECDAARGWELSAHPARLQVHTIDALCATWLRQAPMALKMGAMPGLVEHAEALYARAARAELGGAGEHSEPWRRLLDYIDNDGARSIDLIAAMLARRDQWLRHVVTGDSVRLRERLERTLRAEIVHRLDALVARFPTGSIGTLSDLARYAAANLAASDPEHPLAAWPASGETPVASVDSLEQWCAIADWLLTNKGRFRNTVTVAHGFPPGGNNGGAGAIRREARKRQMLGLLAELSARPGLAAALHDVRALPPSRYEDTAWALIEALLDILPRAAARLQLVFAQAGAIDFIEVSQRALAALGDPDAPTDLLLRLDMRIEHLLVDEFQDTSLAQYDLIERLVAGWAQGDGRTLFIVGDPMQSIYGFREAEVGLYLEAQRQQRLGQVALEPLVLQCNFRAQCELVDWVNRVFQTIDAQAPRAADAAVAFTAATAVLPPEPPPAVSVEALTSRAEEALRVVTHVRAGLAAGAREIAVLVRKRGDLVGILPALRAAGIDFTAVELDRMADRQVILDLLTLTHALIQPDDRLAGLALLRAPWCGLTLPDLFALDDEAGERSLAEAIIAGHGGQTSPGMSPDGAWRLQRLAAAVAPAIAERGRLPLATAVRGVWLALGGPACIATAGDLDAADRFLALLAEHAVGADVPDWNAFVEALDATFVDSGGGAEARVRIMTLHRAKGLEFDVVIMPGLAESPGKGDSPLLRWRRRGTGLLLAPLDARHVEHPESDPVYAYLSRLRRSEEAEELVRLLYVGCTRARKRLHLTAVLDKRQETDAPPAWRKPNNGTSLAALWPALETAFAPPPADVPAPAAGPGATGVPLTRLPQNWIAPPLPKALPVAPQRPTLEPPIEFDWVHETARQIGIVTHRLLRQCAEQGPQTWTDARAIGERSRVVRELSASGLTAGEAAAAATDVLRAVAATLADARGRWLFDPLHRDAHSEYALTGMRDGSPLHVVLDRTFIGADGVRWIVDFKLSRHEGADTDAFLDSERERYRDQLDDYAEVVRGLGDEPIRLGLYFPLLAGWREWPAE